MPTTAASTLPVTSAPAMPTAAASAVPATAATAAATRPAAGAPTMMRARKRGPSEREREEKGAGREHRREARGSFHACSMQHRCSEVVTDVLRHPRRCRGG